ncbi:MAG: alpha/beta hydrolase [Actinomycetia bacterium]|nr:alpha/beta hydrolase [Actinomycetes bacterium]
MSEQPVRVQVPGGAIAGSCWHADSAGAGVLALHGITANHRSFRGLAERLERPLLAIDQRGRAGSRDLPGPYALTQLAEDAAAAAAACGMERAIVVGHSMGAFVATRLAALRPELVAGLVLVDGGLPLRPPPVQVSAEEALGPAVARLRMEFGSREEYHAFWRQHPAVGPYWSELIEEYIDHDLREIDGALRSATRPEAMEAAFLELGGATDYAGIVDDLERRGLPRILLRAPRGLFDEAPLYDEAWLADWAERLPGLTVREVADSNHYTIVLGDAVDAVAEAVEQIADAGADPRPE